MTIFSERLAQLIKERGITQAAFGREVGIIPQAVTRYIGGREPNYDLLVKMAAYLGVSTDYLLGASDCRNNEVNSSSDAARVLIELLNRGFIELNPIKTVDANTSATFTIPDSRYNTFFQELFLMQDSLRKGSVTSNMYVTWYDAALKKLDSSEPDSLKTDSLNDYVNTITCVHSTMNPLQRRIKAMSPNPVEKTRKAINGIDTKKDN